MKGNARWIGHVIFIIVCLGDGYLAAIGTRGEIDGWYRTIEKPSWNPPDAIFGPVWTTLYIMMAVSACSCGGQVKSKPRSCRSHSLVFNFC